MKAYEVFDVYTKIIITALGFISKATTMHLLNSYVNFFAVTAQPRRGIS